MLLSNVIQVFEHQRLYIGEHGFSRTHLDALLKLNEYHDNKYFEPISKGIKFNQFVGVLQIDGLTIEIHPKADKYDEDSKWKNVLLKMLKACGRLGAETTGSAMVKKQNLNLLEVYFELYLREVEQLIHRGLVKKYRKETANEKVLRGKLEFAGHISRNLIHKENFYTSHQVYDTNHLLHQILFKALEIVDQFTKGSRLYDLCKRTLLNFPPIPPNKITKKQLDCYKLNRKTKDYQYALELARLIILNYSPDITGGRERMLSLLFDMNELWEEYVFKLVQKVADKQGFEVVGQESKSFWGSNSLRPDIVLRKNSETYIIDTKWKRPMNTTASIQDLRQMYAYSRFWDASKVMLLYPGDPTDHEFNSFLTDDYSVLENDQPSKIAHRCKMGFVNVFNDDGNDLNDRLGVKILSLF